MTGQKQVPNWGALAAILGIVMGIGGGFTLAGKAQADIDSFREELKDLKPTRAKVDVHDSEIDALKQGMEKMYTAQVTFVEKYDRNREEDQRVFREILRAVKQ